MNRIKQWLGEAQSRAAELGRPVVTLSYAQSIDGSLTAVRGQPAHISGEQSMRLTHELRAAHQAILVGIGTVMVDNPQLTVRLAEGNNPQPVVVDNHLMMPVEAKLLQRINQPVWIACTPEAEPERRKALIKRGGMIITCPMDSAGHVDLHNLLGQLYQRGITSVMVEGGAQVITSFLNRRLVDYAVITLAPVWLGGLNSVQTGLRSPSGGLFPTLADVEMELLGRDLVLAGRVVEAAL